MSIRERLARWIHPDLSSTPADAIKQMREMRAKQDADLARQRELLRNHTKLEAHFTRFVAEALPAGVSVRWSNGRHSLEGRCRSCAREREDHYIYALGQGVELWTCSPIEPYNPPDPPRCD